MEAKLRKEFMKSAYNAAVLGGFSYILYSIDPAILVASAAYASVMTAATYRPPSL
jgi:hypothetical protein